MSSSAKALAQSVRRGLFVTGGADALRHGVEFAASLILARLLLPEDYGPITVVSSLVQLSWVVGNLGMAGAIIQAKDLRDEDRHTAATVSAVVAGALTGLYASLGGPLSRFFDMPVLARLLPIMATVVMLSGLASIPTALLRRRLHFGRLGFVNTGAAVVYAVVGISMASLGYGVWSLCWAPIASATFVLIGSMIASRYIPLPIFHRTSFSRFVRFGGGLTLKNLFLYVSRNMDNLIVARTLGDHATGLYNRSYNLSRTPQSRLLNVLYQVCFPAFCRVRHDRDRFHGWFLMATTAVAVAVSPLLLGLAVVARDFVGLVLGEHWLEMVPTLQLLCVASLVGCLCALAGTAIEATGRLRYEVFTHAVDAVLVVLLVAIGVRYGIEGAALAILARSLVLFALKTYSIRAVLELPVYRQLAPLLPSLLSGLLMVGAVVLLKRHFGGEGVSSWSQFVASVVLGALVYGVSMFSIGRAQVRMVIEQARLVVGRSSEGRADSGVSS